MDFVLWPGNKNPRTDYLDPGITLFILKIRSFTLSAMVKLLFRQVF
jgi:hypothetical protein